MRTYLIATVAAALLAAGPAFAGETGAPAPVAKGAAKKPAAGKTLLKVKVEPKSRVYVDGVDKGQVTELQLAVKPGGHIVRFVHQSGDEHENRVVCQSGKTTAYEWKFDYSEPAPAPTAADEVPVP